MMMMMMVVMVMMTMVMMMVMVIMMMMRVMVMVKTQSIPTEAPELDIDSCRSLKIAVYAVFCGSLLVCSAGLGVNQVKCSQNSAAN